MLEDLGVRWWIKVRSPRLPSCSLCNFCLPRPWRQSQRDDLSGFEMGGNKVRKLEFLMAAAVEAGADCVVTIGGIQSNHCRATAAAARYLGLDAHLVLRTSTPDEDPGLAGNLLVMRMLGAKLHLVRCFTRLLLPGPPSNGPKRK